MSNKPLRHVLYVGVFLLISGGGLILGLTASRFLFASTVEEARHVRIAPILVLKTLEHDFGTVSDKQELKLSLPVRNAGDRRLVIVEEACRGCGQSRTEGETIVPPGGKGALEMTFDATGQQGPMRWSIDFTSNDAQRPRFRVTVEAEIEPGK